MRVCPLEVATLGSYSLILMIWYCFSGPVFPRACSMALVSGAKLCVRMDTLVFQSLALQCHWWYKMAEAHARVRLVDWL